MADQRTKDALASMRSLSQTLQEMNKPFCEGVALYTLIAEALTAVNLPANKPEITIFKALISLHIKNSERVIEIIQEMQDKLEKGLNPDNGPVTPPTDSGMKN